MTINKDLLKQKLVDAFPYVGATCVGFVAAGIIFHLNKSTTTHVEIDRISDEQRGLLELRDILSSQDQYWGTSNLTELIEKNPGM